MLYAENKKQKFKIAIKIDARKCMVTVCHFLCQMHIAAVNNLNNNKIQNYGEKCIQYINIYQKCCFISMRFEFGSIGSGKFWTCSHSTDWAISYDFPLNFPFEVIYHKAPSIEWKRCRISSTFGEGCFFIFHHQEDGKSILQIWFHEWFLFILSDGVSLGVRSHAHVCDSDRPIQAQYSK